jgi:hypothetical protein
VQRTEAALALLDTSALVKHAITKSTTRNIAEKLIRCSLSLAALVASVHLMPMG